MGAPRVVAVRRTLLAAAVALLAAGCQSLVGPPYQTPPPTEKPVPAPPSTPRPAERPAQPAQPAPPQPVPPPPQPSRQFHLGAAATALVQQASKQAAGGNPLLAQSTLERALRIEPANPLLWIMLGQAHESEGQYELAGSMGHKAVQLATGDPRAQASAWRLIGDSLRARGRNEDANDAYSRADVLAAQ
jgi:Flp pilus assembly protein TadD